MIGSRGAGYATRVWRLIVRTAVVLPLLLVGTSAFSADSPQRAQITQLIRSNRLDDADRALWKVLAAHPDEVWALDLLGDVRMRQKRPAEAEALFHRATTLDAKDYQAWRGLGDSSRAQGKHDAAVEAYETVVKFMPADPVANAALAGLYLQEKRYNDSIASVDRIRPAARAGELLPILAADYFGLNQPSKVPPLIEQVLRMGRSNVPATLDFAAALAKNGYISDAGKILDLVRPPNPSADYLRTLARIRELQGKREESQQLLEAAVKLDPDNVDLLFDAARFYGQGDQWDKALYYLQQADKIDSSRSDVLLKLVLAYLKTRHIEQAILTAKRLVALDPEDANSQYMLAFSLVENEEWELAEPIARKLYKNRPNDPDVDLLLGIVTLRTGRPEEARKFLDEALANNPKLLDAHYYLALLAEQAGNFEDARKELELVITPEPDHVAAQAEYGLVELRLGHVEQARKALELAVKLRPEVSQSHYQLGLVYQRLGMQEQAKVEMAEWQKLRTAEDNFRKHAAGLPTSSPAPNN